MNILFGGIFFLSTLVLLFTFPSVLLPTLLDGATFSATVCVSLLASYAVWLGIMQLWKDSGVTRGVSKLLRPIAKKLFRTDDKETLDSACMNLSVNLLGISGVATAYGIQTAKLLNEQEEAEYSSAVFFVLNATSIQLIPTSIITMRTSLHSLAPADILLPTLITTAFSTLLGLLLCKVFIKPKHAKTAKKRTPATPYLTKSKGAGI